MGHLDKLFPAAGSAENAWQDLICRLDGVFSAHVIFSADGQADEIHVLASNAKNPKALTRDIQSAIISAFGIEIDYRIISIAQIDSQMASAMNIRLKYTGIEMKARGGRITVSVILERGDQAYVGEATCSSQSFSRHRAIAAATIQAIGQFVPKNHLIELIDTSLVTFSGQSVALVSLSCDNSAKLLGSAFIGDSPDNAFVFAVLNALNRRIGGAM
ncbi:hypothetical protein [Papillibacter cinnamivorans]|uniref:Uncharacterized protein n=1 Tax=Papillibacter cinnamivorans DSM 12816 TaxID=1122930 RepID=A0A1W2A1J3_9FIRM|nr:hypothetical protein [Papillibacter cinnamivorans]SMC54168.1 hypothetical protein SAMN02745168_1372 [Papillibacter cinnamivorans DSM 12816]